MLSVPSVHVLRLPVRVHGPREGRRQLSGGRGRNGCLPSRQEPESEPATAQHLPDVSRPDETRAAAVGAFKR